MLKIADCVYDVSLRLFEVGNRWYFTVQGYTRFLAEAQSFKFKRLTQKATASRLGLLYLLNFLPAVLCKTADQ